MDLARVFAGVGASFGSVFVLVNAGGLPGAWPVVAYVTGAMLLSLALWRGLLRTPESDESWEGSVRVYWIAVAAEVVAIPTGALVLNRVLDRPHLVVLWVVFVVGAHFLPARAFGIGRYAELGLSLIAVAVVCALVAVAADSGWLPSAGGVLAGAVLLCFVAVPEWSRPTTSPVE